MIVLKLIRNDRHEVVYRYLVEGNESDVGEVSYNKQSERFTTSKAPSDRGKYQGYTEHNIKKFVEKSDFPEEFLIAFG